MIAHLAKRNASIAALAMAAGLGGCSYAFDWNEVSGVAYDEFDQSGEAPEEISLAGSDSVIITDGDTFSMTLDGDTGAQEALRFERTGDTLRIARDQGIFSGNTKAIVRIIMPAPASLSVSGSADMQSEVMASDASIDVSGSGSISVADLDADRLDLDMSGASIVTAAGSVERLVVDISGSGSARMSELLADDVDVDLSGSADIEIASNGIVNADISGAGKLNVTGSATCTVDTSGSGSYECRPAQSAESGSADAG